MSVKIQIKRGTAASWTSVNPTLSEGELGYESDTGKLKVGDGTTTWSGLEYFGADLALASVNDLSDVNASAATDGQILTYDNATGNWVNSDLVIATTVTDLTDTTITSVTEGDLLVYRTSTGWTNEPPETAHPLVY